MKATRDVERQMEEMLERLSKALETLTGIYDKDITLREAERDIKDHRWRLQNKAWRKP